MECEPPLGCLSDARYLRSYCTDSQCLTDVQCPEGEELRRALRRKRKPSSTKPLPPEKVELAEQSSETE